jgi:hypothetical protein
MKYQCNKASECSNICTWGHKEPHEHKGSCDVLCGGSCFGSIEGAVCIPVPELVICEHAKECTAVCVEHKLPHKDEKFCDLPCNGLAKGSIKGSTCVPYPLSPKEDKPRYFTMIAGEGMTFLCFREYDFVKNEAEERAKEHLGKKVYIMEAKEYCIQESQPVIWREVK